MQFKSFELFDLIRKNKLSEANTLELNNQNSNDEIKMKINNENNSHFPDPSTNLQVHHREQLHSPEKKNHIRMIHVC